MKCMHCGEILDPSAKLEQKRKDYDARYLPARIGMALAILLTLFIPLPLPEKIGIWAASVVVFIVLGIGRPR
jgi:hypothetical protein